MSSRSEDEIFLADVLKYIQTSLAIQNNSPSDPTTSNLQVMQVEGEGPRYYRLSTTPLEADPVAAATAARDLFDSSLRKLIFNGSKTEAYLQWTMPDDLSYDPETKIPLQNMIEVYIRFPMRGLDNAHKEDIASSLLEPNDDKGSYYTNLWEWTGDAIRCLPHLCDQRHPVFLLFSLFFDSKDLEERLLKWGSRNEWEFNELLSGLCLDDVPSRVETGGNRVLIWHSIIKKIRTKKTKLQSGE